MNLDVRSKSTYVTTFCTNINIDLNQNILLKFWSKPKYVTGFYTIVDYHLNLSI